MQNQKNDIIQNSWKFPKTFWIANLMEFFERAAYYGFFIIATLYLTTTVGFTDIEAGFVAGTFLALLYLFPPFVGLISDKIGFRKAILFAFSCLAVSYTLLAILHSKTMVIISLAILLIGSSFIKPLITGTVSKTTNEQNRARGFSLFYWVVNIGAFLGKTFVPFIRQEYGLEYVNFFSAAVAFAALLIAFFFYHPTEEKLESKTFSDLIKPLINILTNARLIALTLITAGFWTVQQQLYATMPKFVIRTVGEDAKPEWIANVNPLVVVICVIFVTQWMQKYKAVNSMLIGMFIMPLSAFAMSLGPQLAANAESIPLFGLHPFTFMLVVGIALQGFAECFISPRFLEYFSKQAPKGEEGLYLGFSHLHSFFSAIAGFFISGFLLDAYCPDPNSLPPDITPAQKAALYANANHIWYYFLAIALVAAIALLIFKLVTDHIDKKKNANA